MSLRHLLLFLAFGSAAVLPAAAQAEEGRSAAPVRDEELVRRALQTELDRALTELRLPGEAAPWYVSYDYIDGMYATYFADMGAMMQDDIDVHRVLRVEVRAGDPSFDSANFDSFSGGGVVTRALPLDADEVAVRRVVWLATDRAYKDAVEQLSRKEAALESRRSSKPLPPAMAKAEPVKTPPATPPTFNPELVGEAVEHLSAVLGEYTELEAGQVVGRDWQGTRLLLSSDGMALSQPTGLTVIRVEATLRHEDGSRMRDARWWVVSDTTQLPPLAEMEAEVREMADWLIGLKTAPVLEEYLGPVLFEGPAAVELFSQLGGAELIGTPPAWSGMGDLSEAPEPRPPGRIGRRLLPVGWRVVDDPTEAGLPGSFEYDHDGVPAQAVVLVEDGVVRDLLNSRIPASPESKSNGHGRSLAGDRKEAMLGAVRVTPGRERSERALRRAALRLARQTGQERVLVIRRLEPPAMTEDFDVFFSGEGPPPGLTPPYEAYLLYADGREEPVRGLGFVGVDRRALRDIAMAGQVQPWVGALDVQPGPSRFHIGAIGGIPVAWAVPPVLVEEVELVGNTGGEKREIPRPPLSPSPAAAPAAKD
ncbi:MAG: hypothetical protein IPI35_22240 [Deltaproteobacteria bacterium]|nr:hypothetical protein [Deltaproteobacteria bacterium]